MAEASQNRSLLVNRFDPGLVLKRATAGDPGAGLLELDNCWVEPDGSILTRNAIARINTIQLDDGIVLNAARRAVHSHILSGGTRYIGVGSVIKRGVDPGVDIVAGLSNARIMFAQASPSMATTEQWTYFANGDGTTHGAVSGDCRKKDNGTVTRNWGIDGPSAAPTIALSADLPSSVAIDDFSSAYTIMDTGTETLAVDPYAGTARTFGVTTNSTCRFRRTIASLDLSAFGDLGYVRLMVRLSRISDMTSLGLAFDVSDGTFTKDFYEITTQQVGFSDDNNWVELRIRKSDFVRVKSSTGSTLTWSTVVAIQFTVSGIGTNPNPFEFSVDDMRLEDDTHPQGVVDYRVTWWNEDLKIRSNSRSLADVYAITDRTSGTINVNRQAITITNTATTTDPQVTHWELWRRNHKTAGIFQFVDRIPIATGSYQDEFTDEQLGEQLIDDNHIPPPARFVVEFEERLFLFGLKPDTSGLPIGEEASPYTVRVSRRFYPESWPLNNYLLAGNPTDIITGGCVWQNQLWIFTKKHIYRVEKTANGYVAQLTEAPLGTECPYSISPSPYGIFYNVPFHGPHVFNGATSVSIAAKNIQPFFDGEPILTDGITIPVAAPNSVVEFNHVQGQYHNRAYTLVILDNTNVERILVYSAEFQRWHRISGADLTLLRLSSERAGDTSITAKNLEAGNNNGWLLLLAPVLGIYKDPGNVPITATVQLTFDTLLKPQDSEMDVKDIIVDANLAGQPLLTQVSYDDSALQALGTQTATERNKFFFPIPSEDAQVAHGRICYKASVRLTMTQTTGRISLYGLGANYWVEPRRAESYNSMFIVDKEKGWLRRGRLVLRSYAPVQCQLFADETQSYTLSLPSTNGLRLGVHPTNPTGLNGKVFRAVFTSSAPFVLYPSAYWECGVFGAPAQMIPWYVARWESRQ